MELHLCYSFDFYRTAQQHMWLMTLSIANLDRWCMRSASSAACCIPNGTTISCPGCLCRLHLPTTSTSRRLSGGLHQLHCGRSPSQTGRSGASHRISGSYSAGARLHRRLRRHASPRLRLQMWRVVPAAWRQALAAVVLPQRGKAAQPTLRQVLRTT